MEREDENINLFEFRVHEDGYEFFYENVLRSQLIDSFQLKLNFQAKNIMEIYYREYLNLLG